MTQSQLKELYTYDSTTGLFFNKKGKQVGSINKDGYVYLKIKDTMYRLHRLAWLYEYGYMPLEIDHKSRIKHDNSIDNLREVSHDVNSKNMGIFKNNSSGHSGVRLNKKTNKWIANIRVNYKRIYLGLFINKKDAIEARIHAERIYGFNVL